MPISNHTEIVEEIILARLPEIVRHYDRNSERSSRAVGNAVKAIIDVPAAVKAMGSKTTRLTIQALSYTAHRMMDTSVMNASGARYLLQRSLENVRIPAVIEEFKTKFSKSGERTRAPTIEGLKITLDTRKADRPGIDIQDLAQVKELMAMSRRLGPKAGTAVVKKPKDTTPAPAISVMEDAAAAKEESRMSQAGSNLECALTPGEAAGLQAANPQPPEVSGWSNIQGSKFKLGDLVVHSDNRSPLYDFFGKVMSIKLAREGSHLNSIGCVFVAPTVDPETVIWGDLTKNQNHIVQVSERCLVKYDPVRVDFPEDGVLRGHDSSMVVIDETENPPPIKFTNGKQPPEVDLEKSMAGVDLVGAMVDQATKDLTEELDARLKYGRELVSKIFESNGTVVACGNKLSELNGEPAVGQVWEGVFGERWVVCKHIDDMSMLYLLSLQPPYVFRVIPKDWAREHLFMGMLDQIAPGLKKAAV
jgi:hypothetical protein